MNWSRGEIRLRPALAVGHEMQANYKIAHQHMIRKRKLVNIYVQGCKSLYCKVIHLHFRASTTRG